MSESVHDKSLRLAREWLDNICDEQFLKEYYAIEKKQKTLKGNSFKETIFLKRMVEEYNGFNGDFPLAILADLKDFLDHLKKISPSTRTHYQELDEYISYKYDFIGKILDKYGFINGEKELNSKNKPATFFFEIYARLESFAGSALFVSSDGVTPTKSSARDRNNWLMSELEQLIRFIEADTMPSLAMGSMNISKFFSEVDKDSLRRTVVANTNGSTILRASVSDNDDENMLIEVYFLNKQMGMNLGKSLSPEQFKEMFFESDVFWLDAEWRDDIDFIINSIAKGEHSLYEMFGYNQACFFKFSDHEKLKAKSMSNKKSLDDIAP